MSTDFSCRCYGKWILTGEHSVLRGYPALVFPVSSRYLDLKYSRTDQPLKVHLIGSSEKVLQDLVWDVIQRACNFVGIKKSSLSGELVLESSIPLGAGMGASAALCVSITRFFGFLRYVPEDQYYEFARNLENLFHGESSGVDIAVSLHGKGLRFLRSEGYQVMTLSWMPRWYISYSGKKGVTLDAVSRVKNFISQSPDRGLALDLQMGKSSELAERALSSTAVDSLDQLVAAINLAGECFQEWGLNSGMPESHMKWLREKGALAVKPTGSGGGGYVLSLWSKAPPDEILPFLISC